MKRKLLSAVAILALFCTGITAFALQEEEPIKRLDTEVCFRYDWNGTLWNGSRCAVPDNNGPCTRATICQ